MKVLVVATPKTGNHWLKAILSSLFHVPHIDIGALRVVEELDNLGNSWIAHSHIYLTDSVKRSLEERNIQVVTCLRHPLDILTSLFHHASIYQSERNLSESLLFDMAYDGETPGKHVLEFISAGELSRNLRISLSCLERKVPHVQYERLIAAPITEVAQLISQFELPKEYTQEQISNAIQYASFENLKATRFAANIGHFRSGKTGGWKNFLPKSILSSIKKEPSIKKISLELGYDLFEPLEYQKFDFSESAPFYGNYKFENGASISNTLVSIFFSNLEEAGYSLDPHLCSSGSYYEWLKTPAKPEIPPVLNWMAEVYKIRGDVRDAFPNIFGDSMQSFVEWAKNCGTDEHEIHLE